jgi:hypothetical protein
MSIVYFTDRNHQPTEDEIRDALGTRYSLWERLIQFIATNYRIRGEFSFWGGYKVGWNVRYRVKGRALVALHPQKECIMAQVVLGKEEAERALSMKLGKSVSEILRAAPQLRDGRWLYIPVVGEADVDDLERLLLLKVRPIGGSNNAS